MADLKSITKRCARCAIDKPLEAFNVDHRRPDGRVCYCQLCHRAKTNEWSAAHPGYRRAVHRRWKLRNLQKEQARQRKWKADHLDGERARNRALMRKRRAEKPEHVRAVNRRAYANHAEKNRARQRARTKTPEGLARATAFNQLRRARVAGVVAEPINRETVYARDHFLCARCGLFVMPTHRSLDHRIPITKGGTHTYDNVQLMHRVCNSKKYNRLPDHDAVVKDRH